MKIESLSYLKESPMFQLSLTSKELFHSNFIYWVIDNYKDECTSIFSRFIAGENYVITSVKREEKNKDLVLYLKNEEGSTSTLIIENKVKSIPNYEQLKRYTTKNSSENYILLSLTKPTFLADDNQFKIAELNREWNFISYQVLAEMFREIAPVINDKNSYHSMIIKDYIELAEALHALTNQIYESTKAGVYDFYNTQNEFMNLLREIRLHDFYLKLNHEIIASEFAQKIKKEIPDINLVPSKPWKDVRSSEVFAASGFTRGTGISEVKYAIGEKNGYPVIMGVQIQGNQFRIYIESNKLIAYNYAKEIYDNKLWFDFSPVVKKGIAENYEYPVSGKVNKLFNTYSNEFYYRSVKLKKCTIVDLIDIVVGYVQFIHKEKHQFLKILKGI
jgi:hypothetical protein